MADSQAEYKEWQTALALSKEFVFGGSAADKLLGQELSSENKLSLIFHCDNMIIKQKDI